MWICCVTTVYLNYDLETIVKRTPKAYEQKRRDASKESRNTLQERYYRLGKEVTTDEYLPGDWMNTVPHSCHLRAVCRGTFIIVKVIHQRGLRLL